MIIDVTNSLAIFLEYNSVEEGDGTFSSWLFYFKKYDGLVTVAMFGCCISVSY